LLERNNVETWIEEHIAAIGSGDLLALMAGMASDVQLVFSRESVVGREQLAQSLEHVGQKWGDFRIFVRRLLIDCEQSVAGVEWVCRSVENESGQCQQLLGSAALDFDADGQLTQCKIYFDRDRSGQVGRLDEPWPAERWLPCADGGVPPTRTQSEMLLHTYAAAWSSDDAEKVGALLHEGVHLCPPWTYREGKTAVKAIAHYHFENFEDTQVTPQRIIYDASQPYFGVCQQTFACTNPKTGLRGMDSDFAFFEICEGKVRYWRNYFDTQRSVQEAYKDGI
jgi:ketosteroid isomerase-like protein